MKKIYLLIIPAVAFVITSNAQSTFTTINFKDKSQPGLEMQLPNKIKVVEGTILQKLKETGYNPETKGAFFWKKNKINNFYVFNNVQLPELDNRKLDMYFKVDRAMDGDKNHSTIYLMVSKGYDNFVSPETDTATFNAAQNFLNGFVDETYAYKNNLDIGLQQTSIEESEKRMSNLQQQEKDIHKKMAQLNAELVNNQNDQKNQQTEIDSQKAKLKILKSKITKN